MRILFATRSYHAQSRQTFLTRFVQYGDRSRFEPVVLTPERGPAYDWFSQHGVETQLCPWLKQSDAIEPLADWMKATEIDLVQTEGYHFQLARAARQSQIPHIFRLGAVIQQGIRDYQPVTRGPVLAALDQLSQHIICPSQFIAAPLRQGGVNRVEVIPNGVDLDHFRPHSAVLTHGDPTIAMVAHFLPAKRHLDFIQAARQVSLVHPRVRFVLFGDAYDWPEAQDYYRQVMAAAQPMESLRVARFSDPLAAEMDRVDMVVLPSLEEGFSNALLESMARAQPVIASDSGGNAEMIVSGESGLLVPPRDADALARAMLELLAQPGRARALGQAGRSRAEEHYCLRVSVQRYQRTWTTVSLERRGVTTAPAKGAHTVHGRAGAADHADATTAAHS